MILILIGPKGSGKSHIGRVLESHLGIRFLPVEPIWIRYYDECRNHGVEPVQEEALKRVEEAIEGALNIDERIVFETTAATKALQKFINRLTECHAVGKIAVNAPLDLCLKRIESRNPKNQIPMEAATIEKIFDIIETLDLDFDLILENVSLTDENIVDQVKKGILCLTGDHCGPSGKRSEWHLYMVRCRDNSLYTGIATNVARRFSEHQAGKGAKFLRGRGPMTLVFEQKIGGHGEALKIERRVKKLPKHKKEALVRCKDNITPMLFSLKNG